MKTCLVVCVHGEPDGDGDGDNDGDGGGDGDAEDAAAAEVTAALLSEKLLVGLLGLLGLQDGATRGRPRHTRGFGRHDGLKGKSAMQT